MIRINLLPAGEAQRAAGQRRERATGILVVAVLGGLLVGAHVWQQGRLLAANHQLATLDGQIAALQGRYVEVTKMEQQKAELREKLKVIGELEAKSAGPVRALAELSAATPDRLWITEFAEAGGQVKLTGYGIDEQTIAEFLRRLGATAIFRSVDLSETSQDDKAGAGKQKKFVITAQVGYAQPAVQPSAAPGTGAPPAGPRTASATAPGGRSEP
jgi:type IV pilus assembly protein PilN